MASYRFPGAIINTKDASTATMFIQIVVQCIRYTTPHRRGGSCRSSLAAGARATKGGCYTEERSGVRDALLSWGSARPSWPFDKGGFTIPTSLGGSWQPISSSPHSTTVRVRRYVRVASTVAAAVFAIGVPILGGSRGEGKVRAMGASRI